MKKRKVAAILLSVALLSSCSSKATYKPGTYEGKGQGYAKEQDLRLSVTIGEDGEIYEMKILESHETEHIGEKALDQLVEEAKEKNSADVDTVSGATRTSEGFREALKDALEEAKSK